MHFLRVIQYLKSEYIFSYSRIYCHIFLHCSTCLSKFVEIIIQRRLLYTFDYLCIFILYIPKSKTARLQRVHILKFGVLPTSLPAKNIASICKSSNIIYQWPFLTLTNNCTCQKGVSDLNCLEVTTLHLPTSLNPLSSDIHILIPGLIPQS